MKETESNIEHFNPGVTVDVVIFTVEDDALKILLVRRANEPFKGAYALPGGFVHRGETTVGAAERVLRDKAGVSGVYMEQLYTFDAVSRDPRGQIMSVTYFALVPREKVRIAAGRKTEEPHFIPAKKLPPLAFDHDGIVAYASQRLADKIQYTGIVYSLLPKRFTLTELQRAYEIILDRKIDKRNFRKKFLQLGLIRPTTKTTSGGRQRPALLYSFTGAGTKGNLKAI